MAPPPAGAQAVAGAGDARVIVKYRSDSSLLRREALAAGGTRLTGAQALSERVGLALRSGADVADRTQVLFASGMTSKALAARLSLESDIEFAVPDERRHKLAAPNDPLYFTGPPITGLTGGPAAGQWYLRAPSGSVQSSINVEPAWSLTLGSPNVVVAVIDTGVRFDHADLKRVAVGGNLLPGYDMVSDVPTANDGDGRDADASDPGDWITAAESAKKGGVFEGCADSGEDSSWHGTQTSALIAALTGNGIGMASVARNVRVLPVRVLGKCGGYDSDIIAGMRWAAGLHVAGVPDNPYPARVLNMSLGGDGPCDSAYTSAVADVMAAGAVVVVSAGNDAGHAVTAPANCPGVIAVAGLRHAGTKVGFSDLGPEVALSAPAGNCVNTGATDPCLYPILTATNPGTTSPIPDASGGSIYTDAFNLSVGTSFSAPLVSGTAALMFSAQPSLTPSAVRSLLQGTARPFPASVAGGGTLPQCTAPQYNGTTPVDQDECYCTTSTCGAGMLDAGAAVSAAISGFVPSLNFQGTWWNAPSGSESGWGINIAHQGDTIFATWFTHDANGRAWQMSMTFNQSGSNTFSGTIYTTTGPPLDASPFDPAIVQRIAVGSGTLTFSDATHGTFFYTVNGISQTKSITPLAFGTVPTCSWGTLADLAQATNYTDTWWATPAGSESGWGINFTHQGDTLFATWFTFDFSGAAIQMSATLTKAGQGVYTGALIRTSGPAFSAVPFDPNQVIRTTVGTATVIFTNGNAGAFNYTVTMDGKSTTQTKLITRFVFRPPGTACQ